MALVTIRRSPSVQTSRKTHEAETSNDTTEDDVGDRVSKSLNECYFANKGAALVLGGTERACASQPRSPARPPPQPDIQHHLQSMFCLLRPEETLKMAVKLESAHAGRTRYLVVVCRGKEAALLGIDCNERTSVGLVLRVLADTSIKLDGDGGFSVRVCNQQHIFKPVSVQAMWSALQTLHRASAQAREMNHFAGGTSHAWCARYESHVDSDRSCLNEWHAMDSIESRRPPSPDSLRLKPRERDETERVIRCTLKEIMMSVDLDEVTSKAIRGRLEEDLDMDLAEYKSFIDQEMITILGQMDAPTEIFDHVYLGSEWNASNLDELQRNGVRHILNVTREIDNFFPGEFDYLNIRVYDDEKTDLLKHWDDTYKYISKARNQGSKVLVHCKMGISRSASVVIAYAMKAFNWNFDRALKHVKAKRSCIKPNTNFLNQLETYQGILDAMKNKEKLQRSKSETNLKSPKGGGKAGGKSAEPTPLVLALWAARARRPRSWSPGARAAPCLPPPPPTSVSLEHLAPEHRHMLMPCANGSYSVSPNQIMRLKEDMPPSVRHIVSEIESAASIDRRDFGRRYQRLLFGAPAEQRAADSPGHTGRPPQVSPSRSSSHKCPRSNVETDGIHTWDPGETPRAGGDGRTLSESDDIVKSDSGIVDGKIGAAASEVTVASVNPSNPEAEERRTEEGGAPSRQSSWSSSDSAVVLDLSRHSWSEPAPPVAELGVIREHAEARAGRRADDAGPAPRRAGAPRAATWAGRQCASVPADTWLRGGLRRRRAACSHGDLPRAAPSPPAAGLVSNLKKEFEARSEADALRRGEARARHSAGEEQAVRVLELVGRYDRPGRTRCESGGEPGPALRACDALCKRSRLAEGDSRARPASVVPGPALYVPGPAPFAPALAPFVPGPAPFAPGPAHAPPGHPCGERPPPAPTVLALAPLDVVSTVMSKAQTKKQLQHGKTHPLTRLNLNRSSNRCSNPVYNTM